MGESTHSLPLSLSLSLSHTLSLTHTHTHRFGQMMWRLNFLVFFTCLVLRNSYMLYYICPMHTIFTILVYACLGIAPHWNSSHSLLLVK